MTTEAKNVVMQPEAKEPLSHQELEQARNKAPLEPPDGPGLADISDADFGPLAYRIVRE